MEALAGMPTQGACERCGGDNSPRARFCQHCGSALPWDDPVEGGAPGELDASLPDAGFEPADAAPIVTAVVCELSVEPATDGDVDGWGAAPAPEVSQETLDVARETLGRFGAAVEDLPGAADTLAAVFGPEPGDGDGPIMAVRAADELRRTLEGGAVRVRAGVGTAEIVGEGRGDETLWRERVVDLATGLQRRAAVGEVIVADGVLRRIHGAAEVEPVDPYARIDGDGSTGPVRLLHVDPDPPTVWIGWPSLAGRDAERDRIRSAFARAVAERIGVVVRIFGDPGVGKSRLAEECLRELSADGSARTVSVPWGPAAEPGGPSSLAALVEVVAGLTPSADADRVRAGVDGLLEGRPDADRVAARLLPALGVAGAADAQGTGWALGRFLEAAASELPLAVLVEDCDRAVPWFLELLRSAVVRARSPVLVLATGAADGWPTAWEREPVEQLRIDPLGPEAMGSLLNDLLLNPDTPASARDALIAASHGNALQAEHLVAALVDRGFLRWHHRRWVPVEDLELPAPDLRSLVSLRLQDLEPTERACLGLLAVAGAEIPSGLVEELVPNDDDASIRDRLASLVAKRFLRAETDAEQESYVFHHELVRDVARAEVPPETGSEVHERCALWLQERYGARLWRHAQAIAAHLEADVRFGLERGSAVGDAGRRAADFLGSTAEILSALGDEEGSLAILERAPGLLDPDDPTRAGTLLRTATAVAASGRSTTADRLSIQAARAARETGDGATDARARLLRAVLADGGRSYGRMESIWEVAEQAEIACRDAEDDAGLSEAWAARAAVHRRWGHWAAAADDAERSADHAARAGLLHEESEALRMLVRCLEGSPAPMEESIDRCRAVLARAGGRRQVEEEASGVLAILLARHGSFEEAERHVAAARSAAEESEPGTGLARALHRAAAVETLAGRLERAEELLVQARDVAVGSADERTGAAIGATLAHVMLDAGRAEEARQLLEEVERTAAADDVVTQVVWRSGRARALASLEQTEQARELARQAIRLAEQTDLMDLRARALLALAEVLRAEGRTNEAAAFARRALRALERRGATVPAQQARSVLASLDRPAAALPDAPPDVPADGDPGSPGDEVPSPPEPSERWPNGDADVVGEEPRHSPFADIAFGGGGDRSPEPAPVPAAPDPDPEPSGDGATSSSWWSFGKR